jgi:hypothetical protein
MCTDTMRQMSPASNLVLACLAGLGLLGVLGAPWYAPPLPDANSYDGPVERTAFAFSTIFRHNDGVVTGNDALGDTRYLLFGLVAAVILLSGLAFVPAMRRHVRDVLRGVSLVLPLVVLFRLVDRPGPGEVDVHWGVVAAFFIAVFTASSAWHGSAIRERKLPRGSWERRYAR